MQAEPGKLVADHRPVETLPRPPFQLALSHVAHVLGLQLLRTKLPTHMQTTLLGCDFFVPWAQIQNRAAVLAEGSPHQPPPVARSLEQAAVRTGTAVEWIRHRDFRAGGFHGVAPSEQLGANHSR